MADIINDRDLILRSSSTRVIINPVPSPSPSPSPTPSPGAAHKIVTLQASSQVFVVNNNTPDKNAIQLLANRSGLTGPVTYSVINGSATLTTTADAATLTYANMGTDTVTIRAQITEGSGSNGTPPAAIRPVGHASTPYILAFNDEFNGTSLDTAKWNTAFPGDAAPTKDTYSVTGGCLNIYPDSTYEKRTITTAGAGGGSRFNQKYGYFEVRAKLPRGKGLLPTFWLYTNAPASDRPQIDVMKAFPGGQAVSGPGFTGNTTAPIGVEVYGEQQSYMDGGTGGFAGTTQVQTLDANIDSSYVVTNKSDEWMSVYKWRTYAPGWSSLMGASTARIIIISSGWADYYENRTVTQFKDDLRHLIDTARSATIPKYVILQTPNLTEDSSWHSHLSAIREIATEKNCPLIDMFNFTQSYVTNNDVDLYSIFPDGKTGNQAQHTRMGQYAAGRFNAIKESDQSFPQVGSSGEVTYGGGGWGTIDFRPTDYAGRAFDNGTTLIAERRLSDADDPDLSAAFHYYGLKWEPDGATFFFDGAQISTKIATTALQSHALYPVLSLWYETVSGLAPNSTDTPVGINNAFSIDYVRIWTLDTGTGAVPSGDLGDVRPVGMQSATWPLVFRDEFDGLFNPSVWNDSIWYGDSLANGGQEHTETNYDVNNSGNSCLRIWPYQHPTGRFMQRTIDTDGKKYFKYGYFEARMKMCRGKGTFPAFFLFNHNAAEIDVMQCFPGYEGEDDTWSTGSPLFKPIKYASTLHYDATAQSHIAQRFFWNYDIKLDDAFHVYGCLWEPDGISFFFDGNPLGTKIPTSFYSYNMYIIFYLWMGGLSGTPNPSQTPSGPSNSLMVDYIRVWSLDGTAAPVDPSNQSAATQVAPGQTGALGGGSTFASYYDDITIIKAIATPAPAPAPSPSPPPSSRSIIGPDTSLFGATPTFIDEFDGTTLSNRWQRGIWYKRSTPPNTWRVRNGCLEFCAQPDSMFTGRNDTAYCNIDTDPSVVPNGFQQQYGILQTEMKLPIGKGYWPAFWWFGHPGTMRPEIDIMEAYPGGSGDWSSGHTAPHPMRADVTIHPLEDAGGTPAYHATAVNFAWPVMDLSAAFHTYTCVWDQDYMEFYFDGQLRRRVTNADTMAFFRQRGPLFIMFDLGINYTTAGGPSSDPNVSPTGFGPDPSNPTANVFRVSYVSCWQFKKYGGV